MVKILNQAVSSVLTRPSWIFVTIQYHLPVNPEQQTIDGYTEIDLVLSQPADRLVFDLINLMTVKKVWVNGKEAKVDHHDDKLIITSAGPFNAGKIKAKIAYGGKPAISERAPWIGGFQWEKDSKGNPWIAITCQGEGAKFIFPAKIIPAMNPMKVPI